MNDVTGVDPSRGALAVHQQRPIRVDADGPTHERFRSQVDSHEASDGIEPSSVLIGDRPAASIEAVEFLEHGTKHLGRGAIAQSGGVWRSPADVQAQTDHHEPFAGLGEDPAELGPVEEQIVGPFQDWAEAPDPLARDRGGHGHPLRVPMSVVESTPCQERHEEVGPRRRVPSAVEATSAGGLVIGCQNGPIRGAGAGCFDQIGVRRSGFRDVPHVPSGWPRTVPGGVGGSHDETMALVLQKILIANRGEIAVRVIRAAREMGIATVAVYSELDRNALHVRLADEAYALGGQTAAESYLNTARILEIVRQSGADGVHPGYGFFSENADFAQAITDLGVAFIGPPPHAIVEMGDKVSSRKAALRGGAPIVPGTVEFVTSAAEISDFGNAYGFPVAIKAAFGGGGRGMKVVQDAASVPEAMDSARRESKAFFGRDEIYVEKYLTWPRHIEVQLVGDQHGNYVWVSLRDCSAQRRHQKLIEEAPAPGLPDGMEAAMGEAAVKAARAVGYFNAGTVEFIYQGGEFFFLEMNTRLQVEHPVTEAITGIDLVEWQIRVASGEPLPMSQSEVDAVRRGHAIEVRINAENPAEGKFLPSPGLITKLRTPDGFGVRFDAGYEAGDEISQYYDNLVGKLICWGKDRATAISRTIRALEEMEIEGVATTIPADLAILRHIDFQNVEHSTKWVEERLDLSGIAAPAPPAPADDDAAPLVLRSTSVEVNGKRFDVKMWVPDPPAVAVANGAKTGPKKTARSSSGSGAGAGGSGEVTVPMQGTIVKILVEIGQAVEAGQAVVVLEAMKMENQIQAERAGNIKEIKVATGDTVGAGDVVVVIACRARGGRGSPVSG